MSIRNVIVAAAIVVASAVSAFGADRYRYSDAAFEAAQDRGRPILVHVVASWCNTCKAQRPVLSSLYDKREYRDLAVFEVDYDSQKDAVRKFGAREQSAVITYNGREETSRSYGETEEDDLDESIRSAY